MNSVIQIEGVSWKRQGKPILHKVNWTVEKGEHWAILGLNGSGKTTLLNMINGYIWPTTGKMRILGKRFGETDLRELRKQIGWVSSSLQEKIKGTELAEEVVLSGKFASIGLYDQPTEEDRACAQDLIDQLGCSYLKGNPYQLCSQGERQKLLIARGLMAKPDLLILDEPTNGLDFLAREELLRVIEGLASTENGPTIIFVTHHIEEVLPVFTHTLMLRDGTIFEQGETKHVTTSKILSSFFDRDVEAERRDGRVRLFLK